jgi:glycosyltransferase involved in cell wall biosynthesis
VKPLVLHVAAFSNPAGGGFVSALQSLAKRSEFRTALLCPRASESYAWTHALRASGVEVIHAGTALDVATAVARSGPDVVHAHFVDWMLPATLGAAAAHARTAWHLHSGVPEGVSPRNLARQAKYAVAKRLVDRFYCVSPDVTAYLQRLRVPLAQIAELPNGTDLWHFRPPSLAERAAARRRFEFAPRVPILAFFGRDAVVKGADRLAAALTTMESPPHVLVIAASSETLRLLADRHPTDAGCLADVRDALWAADALALPSRAEGVPYSLLEARGCGVAAVASPLPGVQRVLAEDPGTQPVDAADARAFGAALHRALTAGNVPLPPEIAAAVSLDAWADALASWYVSEAAA